MGLYTWYIKERQSAKAFKNESQQRPLRMIINKAPYERQSTTFLKNSNQQGPLRITISKAPMSTYKQQGPYEELQSAGPL